MTLRKIKCVLVQINVQGMEKITTNVGTDECYKQKKSHIGKE